MGILGFGKVQKLEDLKVDDLKKERLTQQVKQDQLLTRLRQAQDQFDALLEAASEPGLNDAEIDAAAYKMESVSKIKEAIANGEYPIDLDAVADMLLDAYKEMKS